MRTPSYIFLLIFGIVLAGFLGTLAYYTYAPNLGIRNQESGINTAPLVSPTRPVVSARDPIRGNVNAAIAIVEFGDYLCQPCAQMEEILTATLKKYAGRVRLVWKDFPNTNIHPLAQKAAEAARCAGAQGKFWEYHDLLLARQQDLTQSSFDQFARDLKLDQGQFSECMITAQEQPRVERTFQEGLFLKVDATPYFFINNQRFSGVIQETDLTELLSATQDKH